MPWVYCATLGCKANQYDSEQLCRSLLDHGFLQTGQPAQADLLILNTCTVTGEADRKGRQLARRLMRVKPDGVLAVTGCSASCDTAAWRQWFPEAVVLEAREREQWPELLWAAWQAIKPMPNRLEITENEMGPPPKGRSRAWLKVQDGCDRNCTYCRIPLARGPSRSRSLAEVVAECTERVSAGYRELVLTGICLGDYRDGALRLDQLVIALAEVLGPARLRLSSIELPDVTEALLMAMAASTRICPHLHVPLQSGADRILERMGRPYRQQDFLERMDQVRQYLPGVNLTTDVMVGFPGETETDFEHTCEALKVMRPGRVHLFRYSRRPGTPAAQADEQVPTGVKDERMIRLGELTTHLVRQAQQARIGQQVETLLETRTPDGQWTGTTETYFSSRIPDRPGCHPGRLMRHQVVASQDGFLIGCGHG